MAYRTAGGRASGGPLHPDCSRLRALSHDRRGVVLLAVLVFIALLLPLITLVLTSINTESVATAETIKGAKAELAAEKALNDAISLVVQEKAYPDYWTSVAHVNQALIIRDAQTGERRDMVGGTGSNGGPGADEVLGTGDDYWIGPRYDRSYIGGLDPETSARMYRYDYRFNSMHGPTYLGQAWSFASDNRNYAISPFSNDWIWLFNQFAGVEIDNDGDGVDDGYNIADPFGGSDEAVLYGPGYYVGADEPRVGGPGGLVNRDLDSANTVESYMYNAKVNLYESIYSDLDRGPIPTNLLKSYANVTDEAGRLNLNIFCKKVPVFRPETDDGYPVPEDYGFDGLGTIDFNMNGVDGEDDYEPIERGWKWLDNPMFPDRISMRKLDFDPSDGSFTDIEEIDWGSVDLVDGNFSDTEDDVSMPELGENVQHYYEGDTDGDGIADSVESMRNSLNMLMALPGVDPLLAANILEYMNPSHDYWTALNAGAYNNIDESASGTWPTVDPAEGQYRLDACNLTPAIIALDIDVTGGLTSIFRWDFNQTEEDDLPLPPPQPLRTLEQLREVPGMTDLKFERLKDYITIFSYDTNLIASNIADYPGRPELVNTDVYGDVQYNGTILRDNQEEVLTGSDEEERSYLPDLRYDVSRIYTDDLNQTATLIGDQRQAAEKLYSYVYEHLPRRLLDKITLPVVDRMGRAGAMDHYVDYNDPRYELGSMQSIQWGIPVPHRDSQERPYNVGAYGHEQDYNGMTGAGYPALNPEFSIESCLSIVMYRNGTFFEGDDYTYDPDGGAWLPAANRGLGHLFPGGLWFSIAQYLDWLEWLQPHNNPRSDAGFNIDPYIRPHGAGIGDFQNLLMPGGFDSTADLLEVPLYEFGDMSVSLMADPPSGFRFDQPGAGAGDVDSVPDELAAVNYYISFSDQVDLGWYMRYIHPYGPDNMPGTGDEPDLNAVLYRLYFSIGNRPGMSWTSGSADMSCTVDITPMQISTPGLSRQYDISQRVSAEDIFDTKITIVAYDNFNNLDVLGPDFTAHPSFGAIGSGSLARRFGWDDVPLPEDPPGSDPDGDARPTENAYWVPAGADAEPTYPGAQFNTVATREAWAFDADGNPYITARVEVVKWDNANDQPALPEERTDDISKVYLQYNEEADIPFRVDILPVRVSGDEFEIRSSVGGEAVNGGTYLLYDWEYNDDTEVPPDDDPDEHDGTWPHTQDSQQGDPQVIRVTPESDTVTLHLYDLRVFNDPAGLPIAAGAALPAGVWTGDRVVAPPAFPNGGFPVPVGTNGYATETVTVQRIERQDQVTAQVTAMEPSVYDDDTDVNIRCSARGGELPYTYRVRVLDPNLGSPPGTGNLAYVGPDVDPLSGLSIIDWPGAAVPPRPSHISAPGMPYDNTLPGSILLETAIVSNDVQEYLPVNPAALAPGQYWVELYVVDGDTATPHTAYVYTKLVIGTGTSPSGVLGVPPSMNSSMEIRPLGSLGGGSTTLGGIADSSSNLSTLVDYGAFDEVRVGMAVRRYVNGVETDSGTVTSIAGAPDSINTSFNTWGTDPTNPSNPLPLGSIESYEIDLSDTATRLGFSASMAVDGGENGYNYYWEVTRPVYSPSDPDVVIGMEIVPSGITTDGSAMTSNDPSPSWEFGQSTDSYGVYFVHGYVMDQATQEPAFVDSMVAHDVAMVTIYPSQSEVGGLPSNSALARTPMAVLSADPPGNAGAPTGDNPGGTSGDPLMRPYVVDTVFGDAVEPRIAGEGEIVSIRGYNFYGPASLPGTDYFVGAVDQNLVQFAGGSSPVPAESIRYLGYDGVHYIYELSVTVPSSAVSGYVNISTPEGTSQRYYFQTHFVVSFTLTGKLTDDATYLRYDLDYQGDGIIDYTADTLSDPTQGRVLSNITHDYAHDGIGNYNATLFVTDVISGRQAVSHQLIMIKDLYPQDDYYIMVTAGWVTHVPPDPAMVDPAATIRDENNNFTSAGVRPGDQIVNLTRPVHPTAIVNGVLNDNELQLSPLSDGGGWLGGGPGVGDQYEIRRWQAYEGTNPMLTNIWPEVELRSETFTADGDGMAFYSSVGGATANHYKWKVGDTGTTGGGTGGDLVTSGTATARYNPDPGIRLTDNNADPPGFFQVGNFGVREGDLVICTEPGDLGSYSGAHADVQRVDTSTQITLHDPTDPSFTIGLTEGGIVTRTGVVDNFVAEGAGIFLIQDIGYDWVGDSHLAYGGPHEGGIIVGDIIINLTDNSQWLILSTFADDGGYPPVPDFDWIRVELITGGGGPGPGIVTLNADVLLATPPMGSPTIQTLALDPTGPNAVTVSPIWVGGEVRNLGVPSGGVEDWLIISVSVPTNTVTVQDPTGNTYTPFVGGEHVHILYAGVWNPFDAWRVDIPANEWRIGFDYAIYTEDGSTSNVWADASYATEGALIEFFATASWQFSVADTPTLCLVDWNGPLPDSPDADGDGYPDNWSVLVMRRGTEGSALAVDHVVARHAFEAAECVARPAALPNVWTQAEYYLEVVPLGQATPSSYGPYSLPRVVIGGDDFDDDLTVLHMRSQSTSNPMGWDNSQWNRVGLEVSDNGRVMVATDTELVPPGMAQYEDSLSTWISYSEPFAYANTEGAVLARHQAVHDIGSLNWLSDANADGEWQASYESPQGTNPVPGPRPAEFIFQNGLNLMSVPNLSGDAKGRSFPHSLPGISRSGVGGFPIYYTAQRGLYNGFGFVADNTTLDERGFTFNSQALFLGDTVTGTPGGTRSLAGDFFVDPLVGSISEAVIFTSYLTGGSGVGYNYIWTILDDVGNDVTPSVRNGPTLTFNPALDDPNPGSKTYQVWLTYWDDTIGPPLPQTCLREFEVEKRALQVYMMADPPSGSIGDEITFHLFIDHGIPPFDVTIDYGDGTVPETILGFEGTELTFSHVYSQRPGAGLTDSYTVTVTVDDADSPVATDSTATTVDIAETIPFKLSILAVPPSGVAPFDLDVYYSVAGGREMAGGGYLVNVSLIGPDGESISAVGNYPPSPAPADNFGGDGPDDPRDPNSNDTPVVFVVPERGNYFVSVVVTDNGGSVISQTEDVYASGYLMPAEYGSPTPRVVRDAEGRPMHAVRIWSDPFLSRDDSTSEAYRNSPDSNLRGGRLMESDLQVLGDVLTTSPNPNFRRWASDQLGLDAAQRPTPYALDDPLEQMIYNLDYEDEHDFYSTFTMGRININTASEEVLTALFRRIIKTRAYEYDQTVNGENVRIMRWPEDDEYLTEAEARNLARRVIEYRTAYYDLYKPDGVPSGTGQEFGYHRSSPASGGHPHLTDFRVDHLPVIGPWDGTNPHEYAVTDREASLQACDDEIANSWDHMAATYYNFDPSNNSYMFYAPSDVAMVREPYSFVVTLVAPGLPGFTPQQIFSMSEVPSNYAKYLNDVGANQFWSNDRGSAWNSNWVGTDLQNLYPDNGGSNYSSWSFDARNYFNYESGTVSIDFDLLDPSNPNITYAQPAGGMDPVEEARNRIAVFEHNDSSGLDMTAHTYIANPPFRHIFDLFKVIDSGEDPHALPIEEDPASGNYQLELITSGDETGMTDGTQVYSGPSAFRYEARWDTTTSEFITIANYLDDIAPFITCRSYVFRVEAVGAVPASGGAAGAVIDTARISRDRAKSAIVDVGPLWSRRSSDGASEVAESLGLTAPDRQRSFHILWFKDE